jgi:hypothetical protein
MFIDKNYLEQTYGLDLNTLPKKYTDLEINKYLMLASERVDYIADGKISLQGLATFSSVIQGRIKTATALIAEQ